jgi:hypothetical protein
MGKVVQNNDIKHKQGYHDLYFRLIISVIAAHFIVSFGEKETLFELLVLWYYYRALFFSFIISFLLITTINLISAALDKRYDWREDTVVRTAMQLLCGVVIPSILAFLLAFLYFRLLSIDIFRTLYLKYDFPVIVLMLVLSNVYYFAYYFYKQMGLPPEPNMSPNIHGVSKEVFIVHRGAKNIPLRLDAIGYFYHDQQYNFVRNMDGEDFLIPETLDQVQKELDTKRFFRVNRQMIVSIYACKYFESLEYGKLKVFVEPHYKPEIIVSRERSNGFKEWLAR